MAQHGNSKDKKTVERPDAGARNISGVESEQSKVRRKKSGRLTDTEVVEHIRTNPTNRMPTKGTEIAASVKKFFSGKKIVSKLKKKK